MAFVGTADLLKTTGASLRQVQTWTTSGYLKAQERTVERSGYHYRFEVQEMHVCRLMAAMVRAGITVRRSAQAARAVVEDDVREVCLGPGLTLRVESPESSDRRVDND